VRDLSIQSHEANSTVSGVSRGRPSSSGAQLSRLEVKHSQCCPSKGKQRRCRVCSLNKKTRSTLFYCKKCDVGLRVMDCFEKWHTRARVNVWALNGVTVNCGVTQFILAYSLNRSSVYSVIIFLQNQHVSSFKKKQRDSPLEFHNMYNKDDILYFMTK
jgi:hypothetical protein